MLPQLCSKHHRYFFCLLAFFAHCYSKGNSSISPFNYNRARIRMPREVHSKNAHFKNHKFYTMTVAWFQNHTSKIFSMMLFSPSWTSRANHTFVVEIKNGDIKFLGQNQDLFYTKMATISSCSGKGQMTKTGGCIS